MGTDKKTVARRLIHNAIRQTIRGEDPLAVHLVSMSCYDLLREYAEVKHIELSTNVVNNVSPEFLREVVDAVKLVYRFAKHSRTDVGETIDEAKIVPFADVMLLMVIAMYEECFGENTEHMKLFGTFMLVQYPHILNPGTREDVAKLAAFKALSAQSRGECLKDLQDIIEKRPNLRAETKADLATLKVGENFVLERGVETA